MLGVILVVSIVLYIVSQCFFPLWTLISYIILAIPLSIYSFMIHETMQGIFCILDILVFAGLYYYQNHLRDE